MQESVRGVGGCVGMRCARFDPERFHDYCVIVYDTKIKIH